MRNLLPYAQLLRLPNTFTAMADILLATWAAGFVTQRPAVAVALVLASICLYWSGMVWNDYFDLAQDRKERPGRPIPSGRISKTQAWRIGSGLMALGLLFAWIAGRLIPEGSWLPVVIAGLLILAIFLYDGVLKRTWAGPIAMGSCRSLNILLGLSILGQMPPAWGLLLALVIGGYIAGVTWFARTEARLSSQVMLLSAAGVMSGSLFLALGVPALAKQATLPIQASFFFPYLLVIFAFYLALAMVPAIRQPIPSRVQPAIKRAVLGLVLFDAILASAFVGTAGLLLALLLLPGLYLGRWVYST